MLRGIYTACAGMVAESRRQLTNINNLSNVGTQGYRQEESTMAALPPVQLRRTGPLPAAVGPLGLGVREAGTRIDLSPGALKETNRKLDVALGGPGFFVVQTPQGERHTRLGSFQLLDDGTLATARGEPVLGEDGQIRLPSDQVEFAPDGSIYVAGERVARLRIEDSPNPDALTRIGDNLLASTEGNMQAVPAEEANVLQGLLEQSNVDSVGAMTDLMAALRAYGAAQRALRMQDTTLARAIEEVGRT